MPLRKLSYFQSSCLAFCLAVFPSIAIRAQDKSSLSVRIVEALKANEADWKYIGYLDFPYFPPVSSERRIITGIWTNPQARSKDVKISVHSVESRGEAVKWLQPQTADQQLADGWQISTFEIGDEGYSAKYKNGDRFYIEFRRVTVVARIEADDLDRVKEFARTVVQQIPAN